MISNRVQEQTGLTDNAEFAGDYIVDKTAGGRWRIYDDGSGYSSTSGATIAKGKVVRDINGIIRNFATQAGAEAEAWRLTRERQERIKARRQQQHSGAETCGQCGRKVPSSREGTGFCTGRCADAWRRERQVEKEQRAK
jgi:hypothetical protein